MVFCRKHRIELDTRNGEEYDGRCCKKYTNHSLRATGATTPCDAGVPEAIIQKRSGHRSTKALRMYERVTPAQDLAVSKILHSTSKVLYNPSGNPTASSSCTNENEVDPDASFSAEDLNIFDSIMC